MGVGGGSADRKAEDLAAAGDKAASAWAAGAEGERRVAGALAGLHEAWTVLHDRLLRPGRSEANLDHVVVGPGGVFLVDAKNRAGLVTEWEGGLFQHTTRAGDPVSVNLASELKKVHGMAAYMAVESGLPVTPVLCLAGAHEGEFGDPAMVRGVWVVPVSRLLHWLEARPPVFDRLTTERAVTRAMTDFPSTTTDPGLLAAMGRAAATAVEARRGSRRSLVRGGNGARSRTTRRGVTTSRGRASTTRRRPSFAARAGRALGALVLAGLTFLLLMAVVPTLLTAGVERMVQSQPSTGATSKATAATRPSVSKAPKPPQAKPSKAPVVPRAALAPTDCSRATGAEISAVLGRRVQPVVSSTGCQWGTRIDDPSTTLVTIQMSAGHASYETQLETSVKQHRVVYGSSYDAHFRPATTLWVATGQPIGAGKRPLAVADMKVTVAKEQLELTDDQARALAERIALAANTDG